MNSPTLPMAPFSPFFNYLPYKGRYKNYFIICQYYSTTFFKFNFTCWCIHIFCTFQSFTFFIVVFWNSAESGQLPALTHFPHYQAPLLLPPGHQLSPLHPPASFFSMLAQEDAASRKGTGCTLAANFMSVSEVIWTSFCLVPCVFSFCAGFISCSCKILLYLQDDSFWNHYWSLLNVY